jgi:hypothetical protein
VIRPDSHDDTPHAHDPRSTPDPHAHAPDGEAPGAFAHDKLDAYRITCKLAALANKIAAQIPRGPRNIADQLLRSASNPVLLLAEGGLSGSARRQYNNTARGRARARAGEECGVARGAWHVERGAWMVGRVSRAVVTSLHAKLPGLRAHAPRHTHSSHFGAIDRHLISAPPQ